MVHVQQGNSHSDRSHGVIFADSEGNGTLQGVGGTGNCQLCDQASRADHSGRSDNRYHDGGGLNDYMVGQYPRSGGRLDASRKRPPTGAPV